MTSSKEKDWCEKCIIPSATIGGYHKYHMKDCDCPCHKEKGCCNTCWESDVYLGLIRVLAHCKVPTCSCHSTPKTEEWEEELQFEIMEDYINDAQWHLDDSTKPETLHQHYIKLKAFIASLILKAKEENFIKHQQSLTRQYEAGKIIERERILAALPNAPELWTKKPYLFREKTEGWSAALEAIRATIEQEKKEE